MDNTNQIIDLSGEKTKPIENGEESLDGREFNLGGISLKVCIQDNGEANLYWKCGEKKGEIDKQELWLIAFLIANDQMKEKLIPIKTEEKRVFYKKITLRLKKNMKAGEELTSSIKFTVPLEMLVKAHASGFYVPTK